MKQTIKISDCTFNMRDISASSVTLDLLDDKLNPIPTYSFTVRLDVKVIHATGVIGKMWHLFSNSLFKHTDQIKAKVLEIQAKENLTWISGYFKDDQTEFISQLVYALDDGEFQLHFEEDGLIINQDDIFHFGLSRAKVIELLNKVDTGLDFVITDYDIFQ